MNNDSINIFFIIYGNQVDQITGFYFQILSQCNLQFFLYIYISVAELQRQTLSKKEKPPKGLICWHYTAVLCHNPGILIFTGAVIIVCAAMFSDPPAGMNPGPLDPHKELLWGVSGRPMCRRMITPGMEHLFAVGV